MQISRTVSFACHMRRIALLLEFRRSRRGRLRSRDASRPVRRVPTQPSGSGARSGGGRAGSGGGWATGGLRARTSLAPRPAPLLGILNGIAALSALRVRPSPAGGDGPGGRVVFARPPDGDVATFHEGVRHTDGLSKARV